MQDEALSKAGKSAVEFNKTGMSGASSSSKALATSHWKTMYQGTVEQTLSQPAQRSERPQWSLPRQPYSSKRSFFLTENMKSFGQYGYNPREKLNQDSEKLEAELHELT